MAYFLPFYTVYLVFVMVGKVGIGELSFLKLVDSISVLVQSNVLMEAQQLLHSTCSIIIIRLT
jgi:hypothetical protein